VLLTDTYTYCLTMFNFHHLIFFWFTYKSTASKKKLKCVVVVVVVVIIIVNTVKVVTLHPLLHLWYYSLTYLFTVPYVSI